MLWSGWGNGCILWSGWSTARLSDPDRAPLGRNRLLVSLCRVGVFVEVVVVFHILFVGVQVVVGHFFLLLCGFFWVVVLVAGQVECKATCFDGVSAGGDAMAFLSTVEA